MPTALVLVTLLLLTVPATAQEARTFGTSSSTSYTIHAKGFVPTNPPSAQALFSTVRLGRWCTVDCSIEATVLLPEGAVATAVELDACDTDVSGRVFATFFQLAAAESATFPPLASLSTGGPATPGCGRFAQAITPPATIDNANKSYVVTVEISGGTLATRLNAVRIFYHLQVSPAPLAATFDDVPTSHPFFPFIEALVRAGITTGCSDSPPLFCPDGPVTRKQMAAFLARALGLHWAP